MMNLPVPMGTCSSSNQVFSDPSYFGIDICLHALLTAKIIEHISEKSLGADNGIVPIAGMEQSFLSGITTAGRSNSICISVLSFVRSVKECQKTAEFFITFPIE